MSDEQEKAKIQNDLAILTKRLAHLNEKLSRQVRFVAPRDRTPRCGILPTELRASVCVRVCVCLTRRPRRALATTRCNDAFDNLPIPFARRADCVEERVRQDDPGDRGCLLEDFGELSDALDCAQARDCKHSEEEAGFVVRLRVLPSLAGATLCADWARQSWFAPLGLSVLITQ